MELIKSQGEDAANVDVRKFRFTYIVQSLIQIAEDTCELAIVPRQDPMEFKAGQYAWLILPELKYDDPKGSRRAFSISNAPSNEGLLKFIFRSTDSGYMRTIRELQEGNEVLIEGAFGSTFALSEDQACQSVFISGGTGISPFLSLLRAGIIKKSKLIITNSSVQREFFVDEINALCNEHENELIKLTRHFLWSDIPEGFLNENTKIFVCAPQEMVDDIGEQMEQNCFSMINAFFERCYPQKPWHLGQTAVDEFTNNDTDIGLKAIKQSNQHIVITNANGVVLFANAAAQKITGYTLSEMVGNTPRLWGGLMSPEFYRDFWRRKLEHAAFSGEIINRRKDGSVYHAISRISPLIDDQDRIIGYVATEEDITHKNELLAKIESQVLELSKQAAKDEAIFQSLGDGLVIVDIHGDIVFVNDAFEKMLGYDADEVLGKKMVEVLPKHDENDGLIPDEQRSVSRVLKGELDYARVSTLMNTHYYSRKDGTKLFITGTATPIRLDGNVIGAVQVFQDVGREKEIDDMKSDFISIASHQLRTPLTAIRWNMELLRKGKGGELPPEATKMIENSERSTLNMIELVNMLLNISRIESGRLAINPKPTNLREVVDESISDIKHICTVKGVQIELFYDDSIPQLEIDGSLTRNIFQNLLTNAIKYSNDNTPVEIRVENKGEEILCSIKDHGVGIPHEEQSRVFQKFFRAKNVTTLPAGGTGLGLYLFKAIVDSSGGKIWFESNEGEGSIFYFSLPVHGMTKKDGEVTIDS